MKIIERNIPDYQENKLFSPIRHKLDYIQILLLSMQILLLEDNGNNSSSKMKLCIDKMNRLFFYKQDKYFSIAFPFFVSIDDNNVREIKTYSEEEIDFEKISSVLAILNNEHYKNHKSLINLDIDTDIIDIKGIALLEELLLFEPCYVRYDYDIKNQNGNRHPTSHLDINYSQYGTFKLGLNNSINNSYFEDLHNTNTDCSFIM